MRIEQLLHGWTPRALLLAALLGAAACHEADGTDPWPGAYPPEEEIDRPKGGMDAGRDAGSAEDAALDAGAEDAAQDGDAAAEADAADGDAASDAAADLTELLGRG